VGAYNDGQVNHGFLLSDGVFTTFDAPGAVYGTVLKGINSKGEIIGYYTDASRTNHPFVWKHGEYLPFQSPPDTLYPPSLSAINDRGQIVGSYTDTHGKLHWFLATPAQ
jgi:probable HAF family extracellular repeat protein